MRFTLPKLFLVVTLAGLVCAGMTIRSRWWAEGMVALTVTLFVVAAIRAIGLRGRERAFAIAFSAVGSGFFLFSASNLFPAIGGSSITNHLLVRLASATEMLTPVYTPAYYPPVTAIYPSTPLPASAAPNQSMLPPSAMPPGAVPSQTIPPSSSSPYFLPTPIAQPTGPVLSSYTPGLMDDDLLPTMNSSSPLGRFLLIGHCAWSWLFGLLAGWLAGYVYSKQRD